MTKQSLKKSTKKVLLTPPSQRSSFQRWLLPGLLTVTFYLVSLLVAGVYVNSTEGLTPQASLIASILLALAGAAAFWWLLESARWIMVSIDTRAAKPRKKK